MPTDRGRELMRISDEIVADIEARHEARLGRAAYARFRTALQAVTTEDTTTEDTAADG